MKNLTQTYFNPKKAVLPMLISDYLDICDPVDNKEIRLTDMPKYGSWMNLNSYMENDTIKDFSSIVTRNLKSMRQSGRICRKNKYLQRKKKQLFQDRSLATFMRMKTDYMGNDQLPAYNDISQLLT